MPWQPFSLAKMWAGFGSRHRSLPGFPLPLGLIVLCQATAAHPIPDIPVRSVFSADGSATIRIEVDPRCFASDPLNEPYLENDRLHSLEREQKAELFRKTEAFIKDSIEFFAPPAGPVVPAFKMKFTTFANKPLPWSTARAAENPAANAQVPVVITAEWKVDASRWSGFQIKAKPTGKLSVIFLNDLNGKEQPLNVLFPGEESYRLDLSAWAKTSAPRPGTGRKE